MLPLFSLPGGLPLAEKIRQLHDGDLVGIFGRTILNRAYDYLDAVESVDIRPGRVEAEVQGTETYEISLEHQSGDMYGHCSCPYDGGACKHLAALLMYLRDEEQNLEQINLPAKGEAASPAATFDFDQYLEGLKADELRALVRQFAPESYRRGLAVQHAEPGSNQKILQSAIKKVQDLLKKIPEYDPSDFESALLKRLEVLRPFWLNDASTVLAVLQNCIKGIDEAQGEGYLYDDYSDGVFDGDDFGRYLAEFVAAQPAEAALTTLQSIEEAFQECDYSTSTNFLPDLVELLSETKRRAIIPFFLQTDGLIDLEDRHQRVVWQHLQSLLSVTEQREILSGLSTNNFFVLELVNLLERAGEADKAIETLEKALPPERQPQSLHFHLAGFSSKNKLFERRIELEQRFRNSRDLEKWATRYVQEIASAESLHFVVKCLPEQQSAFEKRLQKINVEAFAQYLENLKRLDEVVLLFQLKTGSPAQKTQYDFFKRHKKAYPDAAKTIFVQVLADELPHAGDQHYRAVTEALTQLKAIEPPGEFQVRIQVIKGNYKRRSKLMGMLQQAKL